MQVETRKRVIKLKNKKNSEKPQSSVKAMRPKSKFLELEADEGSASDDSDCEREISRPAKGNRIYNSHKF